MKETGTLESFIQTQCTSPTIFPSFTNRNMQNSISSSKTSPSPSRRIGKGFNNEPFNHKSRLNDSKPEFFESFDRSNTRKHSMTPTINQTAPKKKNFSVYKKPQAPTSRSPHMIKENSSNKEFIQLREKVQNELMLNFNHYLIRTIKKSTRSDEYKVSGRYQDSTQLFNRLSARMEKPETPMAPFRVKQNYGTGKLIHKKSVAENKVLGQTTSDWISKHGKVSDSLSLKSNGKIVFDMLDPSGKGEITGRHFCEFLIEIGFPLDIFTTFSFIKKYKHTDNIDSIKLTSDDLGNFCRADHRTDTLLSALYIALGELNHSKQLRIDIVTLFNTLKSWWGEIDSKNSHVIHCNAICSFLVNKGVTVDFNESYKLVSKCAVDGFIDFGHFQLIFVKGFIKQILLTIQYKFTPEEWQNSDFSNAYKLSQLKKHLILAGISYPVPQITMEEGLAALKAIQKYGEMTGDAVERIEYEKFCEIWKKMTGEILGKTYMKANLDEIRDRLVESEERAWNRFTVIGNTDVKLGVRKNWMHSVLPLGEFKDFQPVNKDEVRCMAQNKLLKEFCKLVKNQESG